MSFLNELLERKKTLKGTETIVTKMDGQRFVERDCETVGRLDSCYGFVVDTKPDKVPALIVDHLYIGSQDCTACDVLVNYDIQCVLSLGVDAEVNARHKYVQCLDLPDTDVRVFLSESLPFIHKAVESGNNVLVHCNAGVSRTSTVAIAYLMHYHGMTFDGAFTHVKERRPVVQPNAGFKHQLSQMKPYAVI